MLIQTFQSAALKLLRQECHLPGRWERMGDDFAGCVLTIPLPEGFGGEMSARITVCPARMKDYGWIENELKWKGIQRVSKNTYTLGDLHKEYDAGHGIVSRLNYVDSQLIFTAPDTIAVGTSHHRQTWRRLAAFRKD